MKNILMFFITLVLAACSSTEIKEEISHSESRSTEFGVELGRYISLTEGKRMLISDILDYCTKSFPERAEEIQMVKEGWDDRNRKYLGHWQELAANWLKSEGVSETDISPNIESLNVIIPLALNEARKNSEKITTTIEAKNQDDKMRACGFFTGLVKGGSQDISTSKEALNLHSKYSVATQKKQ